MLFKALSLNLLSQRKQEKQKYNMKKPFTLGV